MKKKLVLTVVIAIAFVGISNYLLQPRLIAKDIDLLEIDTVIHNVDNEERTDITPKTIQGYGCSYRSETFVEWLNKFVFV